MKIHVLTLFPEMFPGVFGSSILKKAQEKGLVDIQVWNIRDFSDNKHKQVDDYPYGGGAGMVLKPDPIFRAVETITQDRHPRIILMCPQGERFTQARAEELSKEEELVFICGHYEGYDERIREYLVTDEISIGDFVLTGGEIPAMAVIDAVVRLIPGVLGQEASHIHDSFSTGLLEYPHYTRPQDFRGMKVPDVLLSGNHKKIEEWRMEQSLKRTFERRPDLLEKMELTPKQKEFIESLKKKKETHQ